MITVIVRHLGPGPHPCGSPQSIHAMEHTKESLYEAINDWRKTEFAGFWGGLKDFQSDVLDAYFKSDFVHINAKLRGVKPTKRYESVKPRYNVDDEVLALDEVIKMHQLSEDTYVYRGISEKYLKGLHVGGEYIDDGFVSTSLIGSVAWGVFGGFGGVGRAVMQIKLPKGTNCALTRPETMKSQECEVLLPRGSRFKVVGIEPGETPIYEMELQERWH